MRVITDEDVPDSIGEFLDQRGRDVLRARDHFALGSPDYLLARATNEQNAVLMTFNGRHFRRFTKRLRKDGSPSYPTMSLVTFRCPHPEALARVTSLIDEIEMLYGYRVAKRGDSRLIVEINSDSLRVAG